jgi:hypothetical protein
MDTTTLICHTDWFIHELSKHCPPINLMLLRRVSKYYYEHITKTFIHTIIVSNIKKKIVTLRKIPSWSHIYGSKIMVSGLGVLQSIFGQCYIDKNDISYSSFNKLDKMFFPNDVEDIKDLKKFIYTFIDDDMVYNNVEDYQVYCNMYLHSLEHSDGLIQCHANAGYRLQSSYQSCTLGYF